MNEHWDVLVVDDEPVVRDAIARVLADEGLYAVCVGSGEDALEHAALEHCRLVICDLMLPGMSGLEVLGAIRARRPRVPLLAITGYATSEVAASAVGIGGTTFLAKPFDPDELLEKVRRVLEREDGAREKEERS